MRDLIELLSMDIPCDEHAPATVRRALGEVSSGYQRLEDGVLVASELVTNAVLHSGCAPGHRIQVRARVLAGNLQISVHDPGLTKQDAVPRQPPPATVPPLESTAGQDDPKATTALPAGADPRPGGWGLRIVDQLARRWGAERPDGYRVWAELALSS